MQFCILSVAFCSADAAKCNPESAKEIDPASALDLSTNCGLLDSCPQYEIRPTLLGTTDDTDVIALSKCTNDCIEQAYSRRQAFAESLG